MIAGSSAHVCKFHKMGGVLENSGDTKNTKGFRGSLRILWEWFEELACFIAVAEGRAYTGNISHTGCR